MSAAYVVTVSPTIDSGTCVRWYRDLRAAEEWRCFVSASRDQVLVNAAVESPQDMRDLAEVIGLATAAMGRLRRGQREEVERLATHRRPLLRGDLVALHQSAD